MLGDSTFRLVPYTVLELLLLIASVAAIVVDVAVALKIN